MHLTEDSTQSTPVMFEAGASSRGVRFAARHVEEIFDAVPSKRVLARQVAALRETLGASGWDVSTVSILNQRVVIILETDTDAKK